MEARSYKSLFAWATLVSIVTSVAAMSSACNQEKAAPQTSPVHGSITSSASPAHAASEGTAGAATSGLTRVSDASLVCMVNNRYVGKPQIPVAVEGKTYYGCCEGCKGRLERDPAARQAIDPVTRKTVDKASAVIAKTESGSTLYFENEQTLAQYAPPNRAHSN
jgi:YHS domain-containing protein